MKTQLAKATEVAIKHLKDKSIAEILKSKLNLRAYTFASLFREGFSDDGDTPDVLGDCNPFIIAFQYGPEDLTQVLFRAVTSKQAKDAIAFICDKLSVPLKHHGFYHWAMSCSEAMQTSIALWVRYLDEAAWVQLFGLDKDLETYYKRARKGYIGGLSVIPLSPPKISAIYVQAMEKMSLEHRAALLASGWMIDLCKMHQEGVVKEEWVSFFLNWIKPLPLADAFFILQGDAIRFHPLFMSRGEDINLLHVLFSLPEVLVAQAMDLLALLPEENLNTLLSKRSYDLTPIDILCARLDKEPQLEPVVLQLMRLLAQYWSTKSLLVLGEKSHETMYPIKRIVEAGLQKSVFLFLEHALTDWRYQEKICDLQLAELEVQHYHLARLLKAFFYWYSLHFSNTHSFYDDYVKKIPADFLYLRFPEGKTLLHEVLYAKQAKLAKQLIARKSRLDIADSSGKTPFQLAIAHRFVDVVASMIQQDPTVCLKSGLLHILSLQDMSLCMVALKASDTEAVLEALSSPIFESQSIQLIEGWKKATTINWAAFAQETQDVPLVFLVEAAKHLKEPPVSLFQRMLATSEASASIRILGFIACSGYANWIEGLSHCTVSPDVDLALKNILLQGLFRPFIFHALTQEEDALLYAYFSSHPPYFETLLTFHFKHSALFSIEEDRLIALGQMVPEAQREALLKETQDIILYGLWLGPASVGAGDPLDWLIERLQVLDLPVISKALHLARGFSQTWFEQLSQTPAVVERLLALFNQVEHFERVNKTSLLAKLFLYISCFMPERCTPQQLQVYFSAVSPEEAGIIFYHFQARFSETSWIEAIGASVLSGVLLNPDKEVIFPKWLGFEIASLPYKTYSAIEACDPFAFPVFSEKTGRKLMQQCTDELILAFDESLVSLLKIMAYIAEWYLEEDSDEAQDMISQRLQGFLCILSDYPTTLDARFFGHVVACFMKRMNHLPGGYPLISSMLSQAPLKMRQYWSALDKKLHVPFLQRVLSGLTDTCLEVKLASQAILPWILEATRADEQSTMMVQTQLGAQDFDLLQPGQLMVMANRVVKQPQDTMGAVYHGVWIQRLLTSPLFISQCTLQTLSHLIERYEAFSKLLKQEEYDTLHQALKHLRFDTRYRTALEKASLESHLQHKLKRLLQFRTDDSVRALMLTLESQSLTWPVEAEKQQALKILYQHYQDRFKTIRLDWLFRLTNRVYHWLFKEVGDLKLEQSRIYQWFKRHLPHHSSYQDELGAMAKTKELRDAKNKVVGYVDGSHYALSYDAVRLSQTLSPGHLFYDEEGRVIGHLTEEGLFESQGILQKGTAARLLLATPLVTLKESVRCVQLLMAKVCLDSTLDVIFEQPLDEEKTAYLEATLTGYVLSAPGELPQASWMQIAQYLPLATVLQLFLSKKLTAKNFIALLDAVMVSNRFWAKWVGDVATHIAKILCEQDKTDSYLIQYLSTHQQEPWFVDGLKGLLAEKGFRRLVLALKKMDKKESLMQMLLIHEPLVRLWMAWVENLPKKKAAWKKHFFSLFSKKELVSACRYVCTTGQTFPIQALLMIFKSEHDVIFRKHEMRLSQPIAWQEEEIKDLFRFVTHASVKSCSALLALTVESVLRSANFGLCDGFYSEDKTSLNLSWLNLKLSALDFVMLVDRPEDLDYEAHYQQLLQEDKLATIDWQAMAAETLQKTAENQHCHLLHVFLWNYAGPTQPLKQLIRDICESMGQQAYDGSQLTQFLALCPNHPVAALVREGVWEYFIQHPGLLTQEMLGHLMTGKASALGLLERFGHAKQYPLVERICALLEQQPKPTVEKQLLRNIHTEARVENQLSSKTNKRIFGLYAFFKRLWHYGLKHMRHPTGVVVFAEKQAIPFPLCVLPEVITQQVGSGAAVTQALAQQGKRGKIVELRAHLESSKVKFFGKRSGGSGTQSLMVNYQHVAPAKAGVHPSSGIMLL